ncbi:MAG: hypothetical protein IBX57_01110 [Gammaproteobacteria bacterium]|nr:hypothetical protein [Gammaproteobacteria bacterium]
MNLYKKFYREYGLRRAEHLVSPLINVKGSLRLPYGTIYHYLPEDTVGKGISQDHWAVKDSKRLVMIDHVEELNPKANEGNPRRNSTLANTFIKDYHRRYRKLKLVRDFERNTRDPKTPLVINYGILPELYRYTQSFYSEFNQKENIVKTMFLKAGSLTNIENRRNFISFELPETLPALTVLKRAEEKLNQSLISEFNDFDSIIILELWRWLGSNRELSTLSTFTPEQLKKINIIITRHNKWMMFNLGVMDSWRDGVEGDGNINPDSLQKRFLRLLISLFESTTASSSKTEETIIQENNDKVNEEIENEENAEYDEDEEEETGDGELDEELILDEVEKRDLKKVLRSDQKDDKLEEELDVLNSIAEELAKAEETNSFEVPPMEYSEGILNRAEELALGGLISPSEFKKYERIANDLANISNPYTGKGSIVEFSKVEPEDLIINEPTILPDSDTVLDKSMLKSTLVDFDSKYIKDILPKDITASVLNITQAGVGVTSYEVEEMEDVANAYEIHTVRLAPVSGRPSTIRFKVPKIDENGVFVANGVKYKLRKQKGDIPIRKVKPNKVALTSYYGKVFVLRSEKVINDYPKWLTKQIMTIGLDSEDDRVTNLKTSSAGNIPAKLPKLYTTLSSNFTEFKTGDIELYFNYSKRFNKFGEEVVKEVEKNGFVIAGNKGSDIVVIGEDDSLYIYDEQSPKPLGAIENLIGLDLTKAPVEVADLKVFSASIPLGFVLSYYLGIDNLIKNIGAKVKRVITGEKFVLADNEYAIKFLDETLIISRADKLTSLVLGGFNSYKNSIKRFSIKDFNEKDVFFNVLDDTGLGNRYLKELRLLRDMFVDPITLEILKEMKEPTTWLGLLKRSAELLTIDYSPSEVDMEFMRIKGYERIAGAVYGELVNSMRGYMAREGHGSAAVELNPYAVWQAITSNDASLSIVEDSNPIKNINEKEMVTFSGTGGRSKQSMNDKTRVYGQNDMGVISEATVDSGDVAINTYTTANPNLTSLRGLTKKIDMENIEASNVLSTGALLSPGADVDDPKRVNFITIQHASGIGAFGYEATPLRTGYEKVVAQKTDELYAYTAKQKGKVTKVTKDAIVIELDDGSVKSIELGIIYGTAEGSNYPHSVVTNLKVGDRFNVGEAITYNESFFKPDPLSPKEVIWKSGVMCKTAIMESTDTFEDSSAISEKVSGKMGTKITKIRHLFIDFEQTVRNLINEGTKVDSETILCTIEDSVTSDNDLFDEDTVETLKLLSGNAPKAKYNGVVEKIEVLYYGDKEDMSQSVADIADKYDKVLIRKRKALGKKPVTGSVDDSIRIDGKTLEMDSMVIKVYITETIGAGVGDKGVFGNQMKTVFGRVMSGENKTESGDELDAIFGYKSISARIVTSPMIIGTTNTLLKVLSKHVAKVYEEG